MARGTEPMEACLTRTPKKKSRPEMELAKTARQPSPTPIGPYVKKTGAPSVVSLY